MLSEVAEPVLDELFAGRPAVAEEGAVPRDATLYGGNYVVVSGLYTKIFIQYPPQQHPHVGIGAYR
jgi:hypothetical protein